MNDGSGIGWFLRLLVSYNSITKLFYLAPYGKISISMEQVLNAVNSLTPHGKSIELLAIFNVTLGKLSHLKMPDLLLVYFYCLLNSNSSKKNINEEKCDTTKFLLNHFSAKTYDLVNSRGLSETCSFVICLYEMYAKVFTDVCGDSNSANWAKLEMPCCWDVCFTKSSDKEGK